MQTLSIFQDYQINGMDTTVPPTQHQQNHDPTNMEKCEMPNAVNVTDNNVNGGGRGKFLTMFTEFDKNSSKWSYYSTDHKNYIKIFFEHFPSKLLDPQKSTFGVVILGIKLF